MGERWTAGAAGSSRPTVSPTVLFLEAERETEEASPADFPLPTIRAESHLGPEPEAGAMPEARAEVLPSGPSSPASASPGGSSHLDVLCQEMKTLQQRVAASEQIVHGLCERGRQKPLSESEEALFDAHMKELRQNSRHLDNARCLLYKHIEKEMDSGPASPPPEDKEIPAEGAVPPATLAKDAQGKKLISGTTPSPPGQKTPSAPSKPLQKSPATAQDPPTRASGLQGAQPRRRAQVEDFPLRESPDAPPAMSQAPLTRQSALKDYRDLIEVVQCRLNAAEELASRLTTVDRSVTPPPDGLWDFTQSETQRQVEALQDSFAKVLVAQSKLEAARRDERSQRSPSPAPVRPPGVQAPTQRSPSPAPVQGSPASQAQRTPAGTPSAPSSQTIPAQVAPSQPIAVQPVQVPHSGPLQGDAKLKLSGANYRPWLHYMRLQLQNEGIGDIAFRPPPEPWTEFQHHANDRASFLMLMSMDPELSVRFPVDIKARELIHELEEYYKPVSVEGASALYKQLYTTQLKPGGNIAAHLSKLLDIRKQLNERGNHVDDDQVNYAILGSLNEDWEMAVSKFNNVPLEQRTTSRLCKFLAEEGVVIQERIKRRSSRGASRFPIRRNCPARAYVPRQVRCYSCGDLGHLARDCRRRGSPVDNQPRGRDYLQRTRVPENPHRAQYPAQSRGSSYRGSRGFGPASSREQPRRPANTSLMNFRDFIES